MNEEKWLSVLEHPNCENLIPDISEGQLNEGDIAKEMKRMIITKVLRPDRFTAAGK